MQPFVAHEFFVDKIVSYAYASMMQNKKSSVIAVRINPITAHKIRKLSAMKKERLGLTIELALQLYIDDFDLLSLSSEHNALEDLGTCIPV